MEVFSKNKFNQGGVDIILDQNKRLTNQKLQIVTKYQKQILTKNIQLKQTEEKVIKLQSQLNKAEIKVQTYKHQIIPKIYERIQQLQLNINNFKNRIVNLIKNEDVEFSIDEKSFTQDFKQINFASQQKSMISNFSQHHDLCFPIGFIPINMNMINMLLYRLEQKIKQRTDSNKNIQQKLSKYQEQIRQSKQNIKYTLQRLQNQLKFTKQLSLAKQKDFCSLRQQHYLVQNVLKQTQKQKIKLFQEIKNNIEQVCQQQNNIQCLSQFKLINIITALCSNAKSLKLSKVKLQQELYTAKFKHVSELQEMSKTIYKIKQQKQIQIKHKQNQIVILRKKLCTE